jgi:MFS family permease
MQLVAQNWLVLRITGDTTAVGVTVALQAIPSVLLSSVGGAIADRVSRARVIVATQVSMALLTASLGFAVLVGGAAIGLVYAISLLVGVVVAIDGPSSGAFGAALVGDDDLGNAVALAGLANGLGRILGMSAAGVLVATVGPAPVFLVNALSYCAVAAVVLALRATAAAEPVSVHREATGIRAGLRYASRSSSILVAGALAFVVAAFGRNYQVTMAAMSHSVFRTGARGYGELSAVFAVGALCGGVLAARLHRPTLRLAALVASAGAVLQLVGGIAPTFSVFALVVFPIAIAAVVFDTAAQCVVQLAAGDVYRGRMLGLLGTVSMLGASAGGPTLGWVADRFGGRASLQLGALAVLAGIGVVAAVRRTRRRVVLSPA